MKKLQGKVALVTGASQGIGLAYAKALAAAGASVSVCDVKDASVAVRDIEAAGGRAISAIADVCDGGAVAALVEAHTADLGPIDILVNNAAIFASLSLKPFTDISRRNGTGCSP